MVNRVSTCWTNHQRRPCLVRRTEEHIERGCCLAPVARLICNTLARVLFQTYQLTSFTSAQFMNPRYPGLHGATLTDNRGSSKWQFQCADYRLARVFGGVSDGRCPPPPAVFNKRRCREWKGCGFGRQSGRRGNKTKKPTFRFRPKKKPWRAFSA